MSPAMHLPASRHPSREGRRLAHGLGTLAAIALTAASAYGCGGSGASKLPVAEVGGNVITKAMFDHWIVITAVRDYELYPRRSVPRGVVPDPPLYSACIAHLRATAGKLGAPPRSASATELRQHCAQQYQILRQQVLSSLITAEWLISEGQALGMKASSTEIKHKSEQIRKSEFSSEAAFRKYLAYTGETLSDQLFRARVKAVSAKIEERLTHEGSTSQSQQRIFSTFSEQFPKKWAARTSCRPGYVVANCRQYRGSSAPEANLP